MVFNIPFLVIALLLLWFPRQWMRLGASVGGRRTRRSAPGSGRKSEPWNTREAGDVAVGFRDEFSKLRNYVDLLRGAAGSLAVMGGLGLDACISAPEDAAPRLLLKILFGKLVILFVGLLIQIIRFEKNRWAFFAPIFFLAGLSLGLAGPYTALFAFILVWAVNPLVRGPQGFVFAYALLVFVFGWFVFEVDRKLAVAAFVICFTPVLLSLMARRPLVLFTRKSVRTQTA